jgi:hypothetical protein
MLLKRFMGHGLNQETGVVEFIAYDILEILEIVPILSNNREISRAREIVA